MRQSSTIDSSQPVKGGFLLSKEIGEAQIVSVDVEAFITLGTFPVRERSSTEIRRSLSSLAGIDEESRNILSFMRSISSQRPYISN